MHLSLIASLLFAAHCDPLDQTVSFENYAATLPRFTAELQARTGGRFETAASLAEEPILISVKTKRVRDLMADVAEATGGAWSEREPGVHVLELPKASADADWKRHVALVAKSLRAAIDANAGFAKLESTGDADRFKAMLLARKAMQDAKRTDRRSAQFDQGLPGGRALARVLRSVPIESLASLRPDSRLVFSNAPSRMEQPIGRAGSEVIRLLNLEHAATVAAAVAVPDALGSNREDGPGFTNAAQYAEELQRPITRILVSVARDPVEANRFQAVLKAADAEGVIRVTAEAILDVPTGGVQDRPAGLESQSAISLSPAARAYRAPLEPPKPNTAVAEPSEAVLRKYLNPESNEPLGNAAVELLAGAARANGLELVASVDDRVFVSTNWIPAPARASDVIAIFAFSHTLSKKDGGLIVSPRDPWEARYSRTPRKALGEYLRETSGRRISTLEARSKFAAAANISLVQSLARPFLPVIGFYLPYGFESVKLLRFFGTLSPTQRASLQGRQGVPVAELGAPQRAALTELVFYSARPHANHLLEAPGRPGSVYMESMRIQNDPAECLPDGLPSGGVLRLPSIPRPTAFFLIDPDRQPHQLMALPAQSYATFQLDQDLRPNDGRRRFPTKVWPGVAFEQQLTLRMSDRDWIAFELSSHVVDLAGDPVAHDAWPEEFRRLYDSTYAEQKKARQGTGGGR